LPAAEAALLPLDELDRCGLRRDVVLVADADHDHSAAVVRHCGDVAREFTALLIAVAVAGLLEVEVRVLACAVLDQGLEVLLRGFCGRRA
jgi:hypothetical protein